MSEHVISLILVVIGVVGGYMSWRGFYREEFRLVGRSGWHRLPRWTFHWWCASLFNLLFTLGPLVMAFVIASQGQTK